MFEVATIIDYSNYNGTATVDFETGNFNVACPLVSFPVLELPF